MMTKAKLYGVLSIAVVLCTSAARAETFRDGLRAYNLEDFAAAGSIWLPLAEQGDANSQSSLGYLYYLGRGVAYDRHTAAKWFYRAATQGEPTAQAHLCRMHQNGDGVARDLELALMWCELSLEGGFTGGGHLRQQILQRMTPQQRDEGWALVNKWKHLQTAAATTKRSSPAPDDASDQLALALTRR
jgi:TPR repeat protein